MNQTPPFPLLLDWTDPSVREREQPPADIVVGGRPTAEIWPAVPFDGPRDVSYGVWVGQPGSMRSDAYPCDEVFVVLEGSVRLESADGTSLEVEPGQTCFLPQGWQGIWHTVTPTRKTYFVAARPDQGGIR